MMNELSTVRMFEYGRRRKLKFMITSIAIIVFIAAVIVVYLAVLKDLNLLFFEYINQFAAHVRMHITSATLLGVLYAGMVGGLFFVSIPTEILFISFLRQGAHPYLAVLFYLLGFFFSHTINYMIGRRLSHISKKIITSKKFYKTKGLLNKYGPFGIFLANAIPFLPSQPLSAIIGVFNYNKSKFYFYFLLGQFVKFMAIAIIFTWIFN